MLATAVVETVGAGDVDERVGAGDSGVVEVRFTGTIGSGSRNGVVRGLLVWPSSSPALFSARALKPRVPIRHPALVTRPILTRSLRVNPAAISWRRFLAAWARRLSRALFIMTLPHAHRAGRRANRRTCIDGPGVARFG